MVKQILGVFLGILIASTSSADVLSTNDRGIISPPSCVYRNQPVHFKLVPKEFLWEKGVSLGMSVRTPLGKYVVALDREHVSMFKPITQYWLAAHECSHHTLGHTDMSVHGAYGAGNYVEQDADCNAMRQMVDKGFTDEQFEVLFKDMSDINKLRIASRGVRVRKSSEIAHNWTLEDRVNHARVCLMEARSENMSDEYKTK